MFEVKAKGKPSSSSRNAFDHDDEHDEDPVSDFEHILELDGNSVISSNPKPNKGPLIIPTPKPKKAVEKPKPKQETTFEVAAAEESKVVSFGLQIMKKNPSNPSSNGNGNGNGDSGGSNDRSDDDDVRDGPLLQNHRSDYKEDLQQRPDEATLEDYDNIPIEEFGAAMLRGMGWKDGQVVGKNQSGLAQPVFFKRRPHLLGLGASPMPLPGPDPRGTKSEKGSRPASTSSSSKSSKQKEEFRKDSKSAVRKGSIVIIKKNNSFFNRRGRVCKVREAKPDGIPITVELSDNEEVRCYADEVELCD
ncbi:hypothetical protein HDU97_005542 [Phlyctochytrium planicorne]|nr:hypothetical protein HDU97_005542 [Phlyctochytrium planicorne]